MTRSLLSLALGFALIPSLIGRVDADERLNRAVDRLARSEGFTDDEPGIALWIYQPGKINFRKGYGLADLKSKARITPRTMFELASVSKAFTATSILLLIDRGKLSLDDDVRKYLPELPVYDGGPIRIRHLLNHTSGLPDYMEFEDPPARNRTYWVNEDYTSEFSRQEDDFPLEFPTGRKYEYCNSNYLLLGTIVARTSRKSFGTFLRDEIFAPAGMARAFAYESPQSVPQPPPPECLRAVGYQETSDDSWKAGWGAPPARSERFLSVGDGGIWANLEDMAAWDAAQRAALFLKPATRNFSFQPTRTQNKRKNDYGCGWELEFEEGRLIGYGHDGSWDGFRTMYWRDLTNDRTTILLGNRDDFDPYDILESLDEIIDEHLAK
jgi:CubicO group peptidase (beta-lactamase class C family)